jgi:adenosylcobyric acid synthase
MIKGFIINRFRGDLNLFKSGVNWLEEKTGKTVFGVIPWYDHFRIEAEDSVVIENPISISTIEKDTPAIGVIRLPHISNFNDFDPLLNLKGLNVNFIEKPQNLSNFKAIILPGSKNTRWDLRWLKKIGWADIIHKYCDAEGHVLGICGGYQMMGRFVHDPNGLEGTPGTSKGLDLLPVETVLKAPKTTTRTRFFWKNIEGTGYEIHMGETKRFSGNALFNIIERNLLPCQTEDGCEMYNSKFMGTYIHGMFDTPAIIREWLKTINLNHIDVPNRNRLDEKDMAYDLLAAHFERHMNTNAIFDLILRRW